MTEFAARVRRVRLKNGADVTVLHSKPGPDGADDWRGAIIRNARSVAEQATEEAPLVGYLVLGIFADGGCSLGFRNDHDRCPIPPALMPAWIAEVVRRDIVTAGEAEQTFHRNFEWHEG